MFITSTGFKRLINDAYKGAGLKIGNDGSGYYLAGGYWTMWIEKGCIPKKELGAIIELTGELPEAGSGFQATKSGNQYEMQDNQFYRVMENASQCEEVLEVTPVILEQTYEQARLLQDPKNLTITLINEKIIKMIDNTVVQYQDGETQAEGPLICGKMQGVFWRNNVMALHVFPRKDEGNRVLLGYLENFHIMAEDEH